VAAADFDKDGDLDVFRGGRGKALMYPLPGSSYLLKNEGGQFGDATESLAAELRSVGMVTDAVWADIDGDTWTDLVVVGEFMPITVFKNNAGRLVKLPSTACNSRKASGTASGPVILTGMAT
jgi:hypothetical protein